MELKIFTTATLFGLLLLPLAHAQVTMRGNIPFNFQVGETALPAGEYVIQQAGTSRMLTMRNLDRETGAIMYVVPQSLQAESARNTRLVFHRYGGTYFLSQVWQGRGQNGDALPQSKAERVTARQRTALPIPHDMELASVTFDAFTR